MTDPSVEVRGYDPSKDYAAVELNLRQAELFDPDRHTEALMDTYAHTILVAELAGVVVGNVIVSDGIMPVIFGLAVREPHRRQGIGSLLLSAAEDKLRRAGHPDAEVFADLRDARLSAFYAKAGYHFDKQYASLWRRLDGK